jgi:hypothetical protein
MENGRDASPPAGTSRIETGSAAPFTPSARASSNATVPSGRSTRTAIASARASRSASASNQTST